MNTQPFTPTLIILNYHRVSDNLSSDSLFSIHPNTLRQQLEILKEYKVPTGNTVKFGQNKPDVPFSVALSFDDGNISDHEVVLPLLTEFGYSASFFPIVGHIGYSTKSGWNELKAIANAGCVIGSHGMSHEIMLKLHPSSQKDEMRTSKLKLEEKLGRAITQFAFPFGRHDDDLLALCKDAGYKQALTTGLKVNKLRDDNFLLFRWNITNKTSTDLFRQVMSSSGVLSPALELTTKLNAIVKSGVKKDL